LGTDQWLIHDPIQVKANKFAFKLTRCQLNSLRFLLHPYFLCFYRALVKGHNRCHHWFRKASHGVSCYLNRLLACWNPSHDILRLAPLWLGEHLRYLAWCERLPDLHSASLVLDSARYQLLTDNSGSRLKKNH
jgi:hypothetical protein